MEYLYETIEHNSHIPIKILTQTVEDYPYHWHEDIEILFVLNGQVEITVENKTSVLVEGRIFVINSDELHYIKAFGTEKKARLLLLQFNIKHFSRYNIDVSALKFNLTYEDKNSIKRTAYNQVRAILAEMMKSVINKEEPIQLLVEGQLINLMVVLMNNFLLEQKAESKYNDDDRTIAILKYISANCANPSFDLEMVAKHFSLSQQYISKYLKKHVGYSFKKFVDNMRMNKSLQALKTTEQRIIDIAYDYGFPDAKAYYRVFKEAMGTTPSKYRELNSIKPQEKATANYFSINSNESLSKLFQYAVDIGKVNRSRQEVTEVERVNVTARTTIKPIASKSIQLLTFGYAGHGLSYELTKQLQMIQEDIGFNYVRFHGIYNEDLLIYNERADGTVYYNYNHVDKLIDTIVACGLKPFIELGFMPKQLANADERIFFWEAYVSKPKDMTKWKNLNIEFVKHLINRYGISKVREWPFEFWNEPDMVGAFWRDSIESFYEMFKVVYDGLKAIDQDLIIGGFGNMRIDRSDTWLTKFNEFLKRDSINLDFFSFHIYPNQAIRKAGIQDIFIPLIRYDEPLDIKKISDKVDLSIVRLGDPSFVTECIDEMIHHASELSVGSGTYYITEWNSSTNNRDLVHDTCFMAGFIVKNLIENSCKLSGMGYWTFSDIFAEFRLEEPLFHGGFGLLTHNGLKKPAYYGFKFISELYDHVLLEKEGMIVTKEEEDYRILLYNYHHYNDLYASYDYSQITETNRYEVFVNAKYIQSELVLESLRGDYIVEYLRVNREHGSSFDAWVKMGAPNELTDEGYRFLQKSAEPDYRYEFVHVQKDLKIPIELLPFEIQLIKIKKKY